MNHEDIKRLPNCPFCNGFSKINELEDTNYNKIWQIYCEKCDGNSGFHQSLEQAIQTWSRRVLPWVEWKSSKNPVHNDDFVLIQYYDKWYGLNRAKFVKWGSGDTYSMNVMRYILLPRIR